MFAAALSECSFCAFLAKRGASFFGQVRDGSLPLGDDGGFFDVFSRRGALSCGRHLPNDFVSGFAPLFLLPGNDQRRCGAARLSAPVGTTLDARRLGAVHASALASLRVNACATVA
jgi:hypothetical protein